MEKVPQKPGPGGSIVIEMAGDVRWEKVLALRAVIQAARHHVSSEHVADKLIETMLTSHGRNAGTSAAFNE